MVRIPYSQHCTHNKCECTGLLYTYTVCNTTTKILKATTIMHVYCIFPAVCNCLHRYSSIYMATHAPVTWDHYIYSSIFLHCLYINTQFFVYIWQPMQPLHITLSVFFPLQMNSCWTVGGGIHAVHGLPTHLILCHPWEAWSLQWRPGQFLIIIISSL